MAHTNTKCLGRSRSSKQHAHHTQAAVAGPQKVLSTSTSTCRALNPLERAKQDNDVSDTVINVHKRSLLLGVAGFVAASWLQQAAPAQAAVAPQFDLAALAADLVPAVLQLEKTPDQSQYDPAVRPAPPDADPASCSGCSQ